MKLRKILACILCAGIITASFSACENNAAADDTTADTTTQAEAVVETNTAISGAIRDISSMELISELVAGWNLGNTLDATGGRLQHYPYSHNMGETS